MTTRKWYTFIEPLVTGPTDPPNWTGHGGSEPYPSAVDGDLVFSVPAATFPFATSVISTNLDLTDSWVSFRITQPGLNLLNGDNVYFRAGAYIYGEGTDYYWTVIKDEAADLLQINGPGGSVNLAYDAQPYMAFSMSGGEFTISYSLDGVSWTELATLSPPGVDPGVDVSLKFEAQTLDADNVGAYEMHVTDFNVFPPTGFLLNVGDVTIESEWNVDILREPKFETLVEPFNNLDAWTFSGSTGADPTVVANTAIFPIENGVASNRSMVTNGNYWIHNSWLSFRIKEAGAYPQVIATFDMGDASLFALNDYPGLPGVTVALGGELVTLDAGTQPYILIYADGPDVNFAYAIDATQAAAGNWTTFATDPAASIHSSDLPVPFGLGVQAFGVPDHDYNIEFDQINAYNFEGLVAPSEDPTEVDAAAITSSWNVRSIVNKTLDVTWGQGTPLLRHSTRHLHKSLFQYLSTALTANGWVEGDINFGCPPVILEDVLPEEWDEESILKPGTMAITVGDETGALGQELGGPLAMIQIPFFVDVFMDTPGTTLALALDVRDILCGRLAGSTRYPVLYNYNPSTPIPAAGYSVEIEDVLRQNVKKNWEVVKFTACMYFPDVEGN